MCTTPSVHLFIFVVASDRRAIRQEKWQKTVPSLLLPSLPVRGEIAPPPSSITGHWPTGPSRCLIARHHRRSISLPGRSLRLLRHSSGRTPSFQSDLEGGTIQGWTPAAVGRDCRGPSIDLDWPMAIDRRLVLGPSSSFPNPFAEFREKVVDSISHRREQLERSKRRSCRRSFPISSSSSGDVRPPVQNVEKNRGRSVRPSNVVWPCEDTTMRQGSRSSSIVDQ